jgi:two-component system, NtrC family, sensor kinase
MLPVRKTNLISRVVSLKTRILLSSLMVILLLSLSIALLGYRVIRTDIIERGERKVLNDLKVARMIYNTEIERIGQGLRLVSPDGNIEELKKKLNLHYLFRVDKTGFADLRSEIARTAVAKGEACGGTRIVSAEELKTLPEDFPGATPIPVIVTPMAMQTARKELAGVMAKEYAVPVHGSDGSVEAVLFGGRVINRDYMLVDRIREMVFSNEVYDSRPIGTVTIFQDDVRISTNVLNEDKTRAIGTQVSAEVYKKVVEQGGVWNDRAFVVTDWYKTAYEPIRSIEGKVIGILYVGTLEKPLNDMTRRVLVIFMASVGGATIVAVLFSFILAGVISRPITRMLEATFRLSGGDLAYRIDTETYITELDRLAGAFNEMAGKLQEREQSLHVSNEKLAETNKSYMDLIGFVAHELKGILASAVMNAYAVRDGYLGMINFKQRKALDSVTRNLDYLDATVKKFLNLGRIERGELSVHKVPLNLKRDVFDISLNSLAVMSAKKRLQITNEISPDLAVQADSDLMQIVANNLVSNAIKYSPDAGRVRITARQVDGKVEVDVYNDSTPITEEQRARLFQKFSRLDSPETKKVKGTGLGLYITRQIIERHGGDIHVEPRAQGNSFVFDIERN